MSPNTQYKLQMWEVENALSTLPTVWLDSSASVESPLLPMVTKSVFSCPIPRIFLRLASRGEEQLCNAIATEFLFSFAPSRSRQDGHTCNCLQSGTI